MMLFFAQPVIFFPITTCTSFCVFKFSLLCVGAGVSQAVLPATKVCAYMCLSNVFCGVYAQKFQTISQYE